MSHDTQTDLLVGWNIDPWVLDEIRSSIRREGRNYAIREARHIIRRERPEASDAEVRDLAWGIVALIT